MKKIKLFFAICFILLLVLSLASCVVGDERFEGFRLQITALKERYAPGESVIIQIIENAGSPDGYNIYKKLDDGEFERWKQDISATNSITLELTQYGTYSLKVIAINDSVEHASSAIAVDFFVSEPISPTDIFIKNNIIDLYFGENGADTFDLSDLEVVYSPEKTTEKGLSYLNTYLLDPDIEINNATILAKGYTANKAPYVIPLNSRSNTGATANLYVRINNSRLKHALTDFFVGYTDKGYQQGDWVSFQCIEYAGMQKADGYEAAKKVGDNFIALDDEVFKTETEHGITFYKIKLPEETGKIEYRFTAKIDGAPSSVTKTVEVDVEAPPVRATAITLSASEVTLLTGQTYSISHTIAPNDTADKSVTYEISEGGGAFISISADGVVTPLAATTQPVDVTVRSKSNPEVFAGIAIAVSALTQQDVVVYSQPLIQSIAVAKDILFSLNSNLEDVESIKWYKDNVQVGAEAEYLYQFNFPVTAASHTVKAEVRLTGAPAIFIELQVVQQSCFDIEPLEPEYELNSEIQLLYTTDLTDTAVLWAVYPAGQSPFNISGNTYKFEAAGDYKIAATLSYNGNPIEKKFSDTLSIKENVTHELYGISINGYFDGENYAPLISWHKLNEGVQYTVQIRKGDQTLEYNSADSAYSDYFSSNGLRVPYGDAGLNDNFDYRIKTDISNRFTAFRSYGNKKINSAQYSYLQQLDGTDMNCYINSVTQLGKLLNYIKVFRPEGLLKTENKYELNLYFAIDYENDVDQALYERQGDIAIQNGSATITNAQKLVEAANRAYGEGAGMSMSFSEGEGTDGGVKLVLTLNDEIPIDQASSYDDTNDRLIYAPRYSDSEWDVDRLPNKEPILQNNKTLAVATSNQLYLAALWGYRPLPTAGSIAATIYAEARSILNEIITNDMSHAERALAIYDWLTINVVYDSALYESYMQQLAEATTNEQITNINLAMSRKKSFHLEGAIIDRIAVCDGISKAFVLLCAIEDITAIRLSGSGDGGSGDVNHAWNAIMLDGAWYYIDATWGRAPLKYTENQTEYHFIAPAHYYFLAVEEDMHTSHIFDGEAPVVAAERSYYFFDNTDEPIDLYFETEDEFDDFIASLPTLGNVYEEFVIAFEYEGTLETYAKNKLSGANVHASGNIVKYIVIRGV